MCLTRGSILVARSYRKVLTVLGNVQSKNFDLLHAQSLERHASRAGKSMALFGLQLNNY